MTDSHYLLAIHEAGHAVARHLRGLRIYPSGFVSIEPREGALHGMTNLGYQGAPPDDMVITAAGMAAEARLRTEERPDVITIGEFGGDDSMKLLGLAKTWHEQHPEDGTVIELYDGAKAQAWELVTTPDAWAAVQRVADDLWIKGTISGEDVLRLLENLEPVARG